jgi:hypothetical protein
MNQVKQENKMKLGTILLTTASLLIASTVAANEYEITPYFTYSFGDTVGSTLSDNNLAIDNGRGYGLAFAWQDGPIGQGMILLNRINRDYNSDLDGQSHPLDITYLHFNGVAMFRQSKYTTTLSLGLGGAYFNTDTSSNVYPSLTVALGTRYELIPNLSLVTELRSYATLTDKKDDLFCRAELCNAQFNSATWLDTSISVGFAYKF